MTGWQKKNAVKMMTHEERKSDGNQKKIPEEKTLTEERTIQDGTLTSNFYTSIV